MLAQRKAVRYMRIIVLSAPMIEMFFSSVFFSYKYSETAELKDTLRFFCAKSDEFM